ncbi:leukocyte immunoglobulin-like receptor subfamily A member 5 [Phascolarctos cinereus]
MGKHRARLALTTPCASARDLSSLSSVAGFTMSPTLISLASFGLCLGLRIRVEAGFLPRPSLWAEPGHLIPYGDPVTLWCRGPPGAHWYYLRKEGSSKPKIMHTARGETKFPIPSVTRDTAGTTTGHLTGQKPVSLWKRVLGRSSWEHHEGLWRAGGAPRWLCGGSHAHVSTWAKTHLPWAGYSSPLAPPPGARSNLGARENRGPSALTSGDRVTWAPLGDNGGSPTLFIIFKKGKGRREPEGPLGPSLSSGTGTGTEGTSSNYRLSPSGLYSKPSLSALPSPELVSGQKVTLCCQSEYRFDSFVLYKEEGNNTPQHRETRDQADFPIPAETAAYGGAYRCYSFHSQHPLLWTAPSDLLELRVIAPQDHTTGNLIRLSLAGLLLLVLGVLLAEAWHSRRKHREAAQ